MFNMMAMMNNMIRQNPQLSQYWNMTQQMSKGKSPEEMQTIIKNIAQQKGIDLNQAQQMFQQFMGGNGMGQGF